MTQAEETTIEKVKQWLFDNFLKWKEMVTTIMDNHILSVDLILSKK